MFVIKGFPNSLTGAVQGRTPRLSVDNRRRISRGPAITNPGEIILPMSLFATKGILHDLFQSNTHACDLVQ